MGAYILQFLGPKGTKLGLDLPPLTTGSMISGQNPSDSGALKSRLYCRVRIGAKKPVKTDFSGRRTDWGTIRASVAAQNLRFWACYL